MKPALSLVHRSRWFGNAAGAVVAQSTKKEGAICARPWFNLLVVFLTLVAGCRSLDSPARKSVAAEGVTEEKRIQAHAHYAAGYIHEMNKEAEQALQEYYQAALCDPENEDLVVEVSSRFAQQKQLDKALEVLSRAAASPGASAAIFAHLGFIFSQLGKHDQAVAANRMAIRKSPQSFNGYQNLYLTFVQHKQPQEALKVLDQAAAQPGTDVEFLLNLAELYANFAVQVPAQKQAAYAKALVVLQRAEKMDPATPALRMKLADGFNLLGDSKKAAEVYLNLLKTLPDLPAVRERVRAKLAEIYLRSSDRNAAMEQLKEIIRDDPTSPQAYYTLASVLYEEKKFAEAVEYYEKTILLSPAFEQAYYDLASSQIALDKTSDALLTLDKARRKFGENFVIEFISGMAFSRQKAYAEAVQHFTRAEVIAQATEPKRLNQYFYFQLGAAHERKGDYEEAGKSFEKCLELAPDFAEALNYLGYMWAEQGTNLARARELIEKAIKLEPKNAAYLDSLGWVLFKLNKPEEALERILKAVEFAEEPDPTLFDHLGDIYHALKKHEKAQEAWKKSFSLEENEKVKQKLEAGKQP